jgi:hypothetical protein
MSFKYVLKNRKWLSLNITSLSNLKLTTCSSKLLLIIKRIFEMFLLVCLAWWITHTFCRFQFCTIRLWMVICSKWFKVKRELGLTSWVTKVIPFQTIWQTLYWKHCTTNTHVKVGVL